MISRRHFLSAMATVPACAISSLMLGPIAVVLPIGTANAFIDPATLAVLQAVAQAASLVSQFMQKDDAHGAMLSAINQKIDVVIGQLAEVQNALASLLQKVERLPFVMRDASIREYILDKRSAMVAAMQKYLEVNNSS